MASDSFAPKKMGTKKRLVLRAPCENVGEFIETYASQVSQTEFLLSKPGLFPPGTELALEIKLRGGQTVFKASGVVGVVMGMAQVTPLRINAMDPVSRGLFRRLLERRGAGAEASLSIAANRQTLAQTLRRMVAIAAPAPVPAPPLGTAPDAAAMGVILGIDLGTTNTCCAIVKDGKPFVIPSRKGQNTIPSVVAVSPMGDLLVGSAAKAQMEINPRRTIYGSKRLVGRPYDSPIVNQVKDRFHYQIVAGENNQAAVRIDDKVLSLEKVSAMILSEIRDVAQEYLGKVVLRAVITVPAYYNENQRQAVRRAGALAGLKVERILNEPTAAALAYGYNRGRNQRLLVYDLGGGTFDASVLRVQNNVYEVLATGGDTFLGGVDFDTQLMDHILIEFQVQLGKLPQIERVALLRALQGAEYAKCTLSSRAEAEVRLPFIATVEGKPVDLHVTVTRATLEELVAPLIDRTLLVADAVVAQAGLTARELDAILLVGAQTRMPLVWRKIEEHFKKPPLKGVHPDESVAIGAALVAEAVRTLDAVVLVDVLPISIGVGVPGGEFWKVLPAGTALPASRTCALESFENNQTELLVPIYQGESAQVDENEYLGTIHLRGIPPGPPGSRTLEITFSLSPECLLTVTARDRDSGPLSEVIMTTRDTPASLRQKLGLGN